MAKAISKKKVEEQAASLVSDVKHYTRQVWLASLGAYAKAGQESVEYFKELVKAGEGVEEKGRKLVTDRVESANERVKSKLSLVKDKLNFDDRVSASLNRIGIPSRNDVNALSAKLDELGAALESAARPR
ncbi:phasin family protein [Pseudomonas schmalbachii]|uniref:Phasin family protein n=1 Tax=Pseudomonas schmalbachii TaxID=2816993 RepID=A0ABS3TWW1_9PSED|nr:phasin family protein [Pseudomonas schmalbachii]MBO3277823.1 phasin family protein [Pseudomonas schmalbachii]